MDDHPFRIEEVAGAEAVAGRAGPGRIVERKQARFEFGKAVAADIAGEAIGKREFRGIAVHKRDGRKAVGQAKRGFE